MGAAESRYGGGRDGLDWGAYKRGDVPLMAYASRAGRAVTNAAQPRAHAICDRCGFRYNFERLRWQHEWRGATVQNTRVLVCPNRCLDIPQNQLKAISIPADPIPQKNVRVQDFVGAEVDYITISEPTVYDSKTGIPIPSSTTLVNPDGQNWINLPVGAPLGYDQAAIMPLLGTQKFDVPLPIISVIANGTTIITVTCSAPHGLVTGSQIGISGLNTPTACGMFTVNVISATAFTYTVSPTIPAGSLIR